MRKDDSMHRRTNRARSAFTLVEMLVVVAIIGILIAVLLPSFSAVTTSAKKAQAQALYNTLRTGIQMFQTEDALGTLPPSVGDNDDKGAKRDLVKNPSAKKNVGGERQTDTEIRLTGAQLLVHAMIGADGLGTPGFRDLDRDGFWSNDYNDDPCSGDRGGLYGLNEDAEPCQPRYGGAGYIDEKARASLKTARELATAGTIFTPVEGIEFALDEPMLVDPWQTPVLYYRANKSASRAVGNATKSGVYWLEDNGLITGVSGDGLYSSDGVDFGSGKSGGVYHGMGESWQPQPTTKHESLVEECSGTHSQSFFCAVWDKSIRAKPTPVNPDSYLLISAGPDTRYGTDDDIINWTRSEGE
jgi:prepilin-type N-terminal cleavage/methylation domain-containing protein